MKKPRQKKSRTYYYFWAFMALDHGKSSVDNSMLDMDTVSCMEVC